MLAYGSFPRSLLLPEGGRVRTFLICSCNSIVVDLHACTHASGSKRIQSLLPYRYLVTQTLHQSTWQRREQRRPQLRPQHQRRRWRPQTSPPRVDCSTAIRKKDVRSFNISWASLKNLKKNFKFGWEFFFPCSARPRQRFEQSRFSVWRSCFSL